MTSPSPLQAVLLFQHHQTTTPFAGTASTATTRTSPKGAPKKEPATGPGPEGEEPEGEEEEQEGADNGEEHQ